MVPKIADFGLSRCLDKDQTWVITSSLCGSLGYLAPEFLRGGQGTFASDIYSLGVIIVEILTGGKEDPDYENVIKSWMNRLEGSDQWETQLEQVRVCIKIGIECTDSNKKKRPVIRNINDRLYKMANTAETGTSSQSVEQQVSLLKERYCQEEKAKLSSEYLGKDIKEHAETEEPAEDFGTPKKDNWQQGREEAPGDQWPLWEDTKQNVIPQGAGISSSNSGLLYKLNNLDIFNTKARRNYVKYGGPILEKMRGVKLFKRAELKQILKDKNSIGIDGFGEIYKGHVDDLPVTLRKLLGGTVLDKEQFAYEVIIQSQINHRNIVRLLGCCVEADNPMLIYELPSKGSLHDILHNTDKVPLSLDLRLSIAASLARGLAYMHSQAQSEILHGSLKPANILVDKNFEPRISDFGISRMDVRDYKQTTIVIGDIAYKDPLYLQTGVPTGKSDVYSFGVVMLELLTRKKAIQSGNKSIVSYFLEDHEKGRKSTRLFDKEIAVTGDLELLENVAKIAVECLNHDVDLRPEMTEIAESLLILRRSRDLSLQVDASTG